MGKILLCRESEWHGYSGSGLGHFCRLAIGLFILGIGSCMQAQVATGAPPFSTIAGSPDQVNLANLNVHFSVPVFQKSGIGMPFTYALGYDNSIWSPMSGKWEPAANWGWTAETQTALGYISYTVNNTSCSYFYAGRLYHVNFTDYTNWAYHDPLGVIHAAPFLDPVGDPPSQCNLTFIKSSESGVMGDGSGYTITATAAPSATLTSRDGRQIDAPLQNGAGAGTVTDANGNSISMSNGSFTDTLGMTALTVSGSGTTSSPLQYTYTNAQSSPGPETITVNYTNQNIQTNFGCSGVAEYSASNVPLVSSIGLPDGTSYQFNYESTPGYLGDITGRIASIILPTGGKILYAYSGGNNGITCADGSTATLSRTTPDSPTAWQYAHTENGTAWQTTVTDPDGNQSIYDFQGISLPSKLA